MVMYEASLMGVLRILLWIILVSMVIRLVARMALPHVIRKGEEAMREQARRQAESRRPPRQEGEVTIEKPGKKGETKSGGDYVDYVEIRD